LSGDWSYWSSSTRSGDTSIAWVIQFWLSNVTTLGKTGGEFARCVRGGP
jgi:hypothetical protein